MRRLAIFMTLGLFACSEHPDDGTVVKPGPGVLGVPGGAEGVSASRAVPISGGTLLITKDKLTAVAADPDRDRVWLVNLEQGSFSEVALQPGDEPGRAVEDDSGRVHVALRSGGAVVSIDLATAQIASRVDVCPAPRGLDYDTVSGQLHVACQTGELVTLDAAGTIVRTMNLGLRDLRDVIVDHKTLVDGTVINRLLVSRFRSAELLVVDGVLGQVTSTHQPATDEFTQRTPFVAWRTVRDPSGAGVFMLHQRGSNIEVGVQPGGYGSPGFVGCNPGGGIVDETITRIDPEQPSNPPPPPLPMIAGPTDLSVSDSGAQIALVATGNSWSVEQPELGLPSLPRVMVVNWGSDFGSCAAPTVPGVDGEPTAIAWWGGKVVVQSREPAQLQIIENMMVTRTISLSDDSRADTGLALFHMNVGSGVSCSSCHAEGNEDGRTWSFASIGQRRTQPLAGGVMSRAPFHWDGTLETFHSLVSEVMVSRMSSPRPNKTQETRFASWIDTIPAPKTARVDAAAAARGQALFNDVTVGCSSCHTGPALTNNQAFDVGTGGQFQVPSLIGVAARAPFMHDGCATTLHGRFGPCGGYDKHGVTSHLTDAQIDDLVAYLESL